MKNLYLLSLVFFVLNVNAQQKYLVKFKDKNNTPFSIDNPIVYLSQRAIDRRLKQNIKITEHDFPPNPAYVAELKTAGASVLGYSKWMNAALISLPESKLQDILKLPNIAGLVGGFSRGLESGGSPIGTAQNGTKKLDNYFYDPGTSANQLNMLEADIMHAQGFTGKNILIGILDSGFSNANNLDVFKHIFDEKRVIDTYNFVNKGNSVYLEHSHGTNVLSCIGANLEGKMIGTAPDASFVLYVTENVRSETRQEEVNWLLGAERADSVGVDVINSSLGYSTFDFPEMNYNYTMLDGNQAICTQAADWAASKGIIVVVSAGNEGNNSWKYISTPADADSVIAVAAVDANEKYAFFSSIGPSADNQIKPEIAAKGQLTTVAFPQNSVGASNGTSFSSPLIAGFMAGLKQAFPDLTAIELREILLKSGSQADLPDNKLGYGVPSFTKAYALAEINNLLKNAEKKLIVFPNPLEKTDVLKVYLNIENMEQPVNLSISDATGRVIFERQYAEKFIEVPTKAFGHPTGLYFVKVYNEHFSYSEKILMH